MYARSRGKKIIFTCTEREREREREREFLKGIPQTRGGCCIIPV
jgi:hypothetical protein